VKAPKFENMPGFRLEENGLFEVKSIITEEGLMFVNFDTSTQALPFDSVKSGLMPATCEWLEGIAVACAVNWKQIGMFCSRRRECGLTLQAIPISDQARRSRTQSGWFAARKQKSVRLLGPLSIAKELDEQLWCTLTLLPSTVTSSTVRIDVFAKAGKHVPKASLERWIWMLQEEVKSVAVMRVARQKVDSEFAYECGGESERLRLACPVIDLS
jgi:hypothetical protein